MKHSLQLRLSQHLTLTPQLQQSIRLLQLSTLELNQEIEQLLQDNPLLERAELAEMPADLRQESGHSPADSAESADTRESPDRDQSSAATTADFDLGGPAYSSGGDSEDDEFPPIAEHPETLREHLNDQLVLLHLTERDRQLVMLLIDALDDDGYLTQELQDISDMLPEELGVEPEELSIALKHLQHLDPAGVGARNLAECLSLQLSVLPESAPGSALARQIVSNHLDALATRDFTGLRRALKCNDTELRAAQKLITSLNPRPGRRYSQDETRYVIPDVHVRKIKGVWVAALNPDAMPRLRVNQMYARILQGNRGSASQLGAQLQEAKWLIKNVQQRFDTILRVSQAIVDRQRNFLEHGAVAMRPLVLREIAETLGLHESTVSRVTTQKFMHTPRGIFELKYFFGSHVATDSGGAASSTAIRALIKQLVSAENRQNPLSDGQISELLGQQGIVVARRTVAKYRESLQILPVNLRKSL